MRPRQLDQAAMRLAHRLPMPTTRKTAAARKLKAQNIGKRLTIIVPLSPRVVSVPSLENTCETFKGWKASRGP